MTDHEMQADSVKLSIDGLTRVVPRAQLDYAKWRLENRIPEQCRDDYRKSLVTALDHDRQKLDDLEHESSTVDNFVNNLLMLTALDALDSEVSP